MLVISAPRSTTIESSGNEMSIAATSFVGCGVYKSFDPSRIFNAKANGSMSPAELRRLSITVAVSPLMSSNTCFAVTKTCFPSLESLVAKRAMTKPVPPRVPFSPGLAEGPNTMNVVSISVVLISGEWRALSPFWGEAVVCCAIAETDPNMTTKRTNLMVWFMRRILLEITRRMQGEHVKDIWKTCEASPIIAFSANPLLWPPSARLKPRPFKAVWQAARRTHRKIVKDLIL